MKFELQFLVPYTAGWFHTTAPPPWLASQIETKPGKRENVLCHKLNSAEETIIEKAQSNLAIHKIINNDRG